jgi:flagellar assembly protein FliH
MMNSLPELPPAENVLRGDRAGTATTARFDTDLRSPIGLGTPISAQLRAEAQAAGYAAGWAQGRREAEAAAQVERQRLAAEAERIAELQAERLAQGLAAIAGAAAQLERRMVPLATDMEEAVVRLGFGVAEAIIGRELSITEDPGREAVARALALAPGGRPVTVRIHPADHAALAGPDAGTFTITIDGRPVTVQADPGLHPGDAIADCDATTVDARIAEGLDRVREVLGL